jgi:hypothetical protein
VPGEPINTSRPTDAARQASTALRTGPNRTPPQALTSDPATAPRLSASRNTSAGPSSNPARRISAGSQVPSPYQAKSVARVAAANSTVGRSNCPRNSAAGPVTSAASAVSAAGPVTGVGAVGPVTGVDEVGCPGSPKRRSTRSASTTRPRERNQAGDSGSRQTHTGSTSTSASSAIPNIGRQPCAGSTAIPITAAAEPPIGIPDIIRVATTERCLAPTNSAPRAFAEGTRPPNPRPASSRNAPSATGPAAIAHSPVNTENHNTQPRIVVRRPNRSHSAPASSAPNSIPRKARLPSRPAAAGVSPQAGSASSAGSTVP